MAQSLTVLGIETSCDETAAAVVQMTARGEATILSDVVLSQLDDHAPYGGVVPEIAARAHVAHLDGLIVRAMDDAGMDFSGLDAVAATAGPGLIGGVLAGLTTAKSIAMSLDVPLLAINHLEGHALTPRLTDGTQFPYLLLLVSGGHTQIISVEGLGNYRRLGTTIDDALGEAFDKVAKLLGLSYPGGPEVERAAIDGDGGRFSFPRPLKGQKNCDFSFSGLKTAVRRAALELEPATDRDVADICASFQTAVIETVTDRLKRAVQIFREQHQDIAQPSIVISGGVAANKALSAGLKGLAESENFKLIVPPPALCTDNAVMIAWAGCEHLAAGHSDGLDAMARARWPLDASAEPAIGSGSKGAKA
ncbi:MAG: tRNA (adenosine(37)-N6)-threonylcarbamoyltransferase complex transferase subunit TsaD [Hyphomicrobiales bacterium]